MEAIRDHIISCFKTVKMKLLSSAAQFPFLSITLVIMITTLLLPLVSATALMPVVALFYIGEYLESKGLLSVVYAICCQGFLIAALLIFLYGISFMVATVANVLHSRYFSKTNAGKRV